MAGDGRLKSGDERIHLLDETEEPAAVSPFAKKGQAAREPLAGGLLGEASRGARGLWAKLSDPLIIFLILCSAGLAHFFPLISLAPAYDTRAPASRFLVDPYPMPGPIPFQNLSKQAQDDFTLDGRVPMLPWFRNDKGEGSPTWPQEYIEKFVAAADQRVADCGSALCPYGTPCNQAFFDAISEHPIAGQNVLVVGSITPWLEAICLSFGANSTTTVDFTLPLVDHPKIRTLSIADLDASSEVFDAVLSYSSLEHDGLGRYGDPLNPWGDIERVKKLKGLLRPHGTFFLGVPNGPDALVFNAHRVYGPIRFPMLIEGWELLGTYGASLEDLYAGRFKAWAARPTLGLHGGCLMANASRVGCFQQPVNVLKSL